MFTQMAGDCVVRVRISASDPCSQQRFSGRSAFKAQDYALGGLWGKIYWEIRVFSLHTF